MSPVRVAVVDDHPIVLRGVADLLAQSPDFAVVGTAVTVDDAVPLALSNAADILLMDLRLGDDLAVDALPRIATEAPGVRVVILTAFDDGDLIRHCLAHGVRGVLLKDASGLDLVEALRRIVAGEQVVDPRLTARSFHAEGEGRLRDGGYERLSARESEILRLLARGLNTREMAAELNLMPNTVRSYTQTVLEKLQSKNRVMALATARRLRLI